MSINDDKLIKNHEYDGIQELDNDLPPWWVNLFIGTTIFAIIYLGYYHVFNLGPLQEESFKNELASWESKGISDSSGRNLYAINCLSCHGNEGQGAPSIKAPQIAGQEDWYLKTQIANFKDGIRGSHEKDIAGATMKAIANSAIQNDKDAEAIIEYVSNLKPSQLNTTIEGNIEKGKTLYMACLACHGDKAQGNPTLKAPKLAGLNDWYIVAQLHNFKEGIRGSDPKDMAGMMMRPMSLSLSTQDMNDLAVYIMSLNQ